MEINKFDYEVEYKANGEIKVEIVVLEEFIDSDFVRDFIYDKLEELEETSNIEILHIEPVRDYNVNVYNL